MTRRNPSLSLIVPHQILHSHNSSSLTSQARHVTAVNYPQSSVLALWLLDARVGDTDLPNSWLGATPAAGGHVQHTNYRPIVSLHHGLCCFNCPYAQGLSSSPALSTVLLSLNVSSARHAICVLAFIGNRLNSFIRRRIETRKRLLLLKCKWNGVCVVINRISTEYN